MSGLEIVLLIAVVGLILGMCVYAVRLAKRER